MKENRDDITYDGVVFGDRGIYRLSIVKQTEFPREDETRISYLPNIILCGEHIDESFAEEVMNLYLKKIRNGEVKSFVEGE